jgi:CubicO group peptidase (beta-lactamase class C family)
MRRGLLLLPIAVLLLLSGARPAADDVLLDVFERYLDSLRRQAGIPGLAVAIVGEDDILWERGFGLQDVEQSIGIRGDTPFHVNGLTQTFTAALVLRCAEDGRLRLDQRVATFDSEGVEPDATIAHLLTHTSNGPNGLVFSYRPERLAPLWRAVRACTNNSYRETLANLLDRVAMQDSVPGADAVSLPPGAEGQFEPAIVERYRNTLTRVATPYAVDRRGRAARSQYTATNLSPGDGLIASVRDLAQFDLALRKGVLLREDTLAASWIAPASPMGTPLPHGMGWFVQSYNGELIAWQFGNTPNASSALLIKVPGRRLMLIALANSDGLTAPYPMTLGDVTVSPIARLFLQVFLG